MREQIEVERLTRERDEAREQARGYRDAYNAVNPLAGGGPDPLPWETPASSTSRSCEEA